MAIFAGVVAADGDGVCWVADVDHMQPAGEDDEIVDDFTSIARVITEQNNVRLEGGPGPRTHGDYFWAAAQAIKAATDYGTGEVAMAAA